MDPADAYSQLGVAAFAFVCRREYEPFMLNGDAHHSLVWEIEPRIMAVVELSKTAPS